MFMKHIKNIRLFAVAAFAALIASPSAFSATPPDVGSKAPDFTLKTLDDKKVQLTNLATNGPVVLVVLRGWPGYQCPVCTAQVRDYIANREAFANAKATVLMVYPGPSDALKTHAEDFLKNKEWPKEFVFVTDPDYALVNAYGLRWNAKSETAYPSTFVVDSNGTVRFAKISHTHGNRVAASEALAGLKNLKN